MRNFPLFMLGFVTFLGGGALTMCAVGLVPPLPFTWVGALLGIGLMAGGCAMIELSSQTGDHS